VAGLETINKQYKVLIHTTHVPWLQGSVGDHPFTDTIAHTGDYAQWAVPQR